MKYFYMIMIPLTLILILVNILLPVFLMFGYNIPDTFPMYSIIAFFVVYGITTIVSIIDFEITGE